MTGRWKWGWVAVVALLVTICATACQPISASSARTAAATSAQATQDVRGEANKAVMRAWIDTINAGDIGALERAVDKYYSTDYVLHDPSVPNFSGGAATVKKLIRESVQTLPDAEIVIENLIAEGDVVAIRQTVTGTQPDGQPLTFSVMSILRFADGRIAEEWELVAPLGEEVVGSDIGGD